jgi:hypothetical protein
MELYLQSPQYVFMECCLVKHRNNFTFTLTVCHGSHGGNNANAIQRKTLKFCSTIELLKLCKFVLV